MTTFESWLKKECSSEQLSPVLEQTKDVVVTAGAGSGKTRTLISRYLSLLLHYQDPRRLIAITFTEKAAEEMRSRVSSSLLELIAISESVIEKKGLRKLYNQLATARISTIHSLCLEILMDDPSAAGIDPDSGILEEVEAGLLKQGVIRTILDQIAENPRFELVFLQIDSNRLQKMFSFMLDNRLKIQESYNGIKPFSQVVDEFFKMLFEDPKIQDLLKELRSYEPQVLDSLGALEQADAILNNWESARQAFLSGNYADTARLLFRMRYTHMRRFSRKKHSAASCLINFRSVFDENYAPALRFRDSDEVDWLNETEYQLVRELLLEIFELLNTRYKQELMGRASLDFDSLEELAVKLLRIPEIRAKWQTKVDSLMVDEFQDTNERQREIVISLTCDRPGKLFVVGDARQSIYRFRQADVGVFRRMIAENVERGGKVFELGTSFRTHRLLLESMEGILAPIMGTIEDPTRIFKVQFTPLKAFFEKPNSLVREPYCEFILTPNTESAESGKLMMAYALINRLIQARDEGEIRNWSEVAILCRTTNSFGYYEEALDEACIPYVTTSGKGFFQRPEVRDLVNVLRAIANPADDLVMAGLLRSPMFGLSDTALLQLRGTGGLNYYETLLSELPNLSETDHQRALIARQRLDELLEVVDRIPAADLIKKLVDLTHYLAILSAANHGNSQRQWRNIEKLIKDARVSGRVLLRDYLDLIDDYAELNLESAEAPSESLDAVRIMTIHAAKGLDFPLVVLGEASRQKDPKFDSDIIYDKTTGLAFSTRNDTLHYNLSKGLDDEEASAELERLLYVALTRAASKLIINGILTRNSKGELSPENWLFDMAQGLGTDFPLEPNRYQLDGGRYLVQISSPNGIDLSMPVSKGFEDIPNLEFGKMMLGDLRKFRQSYVEVERETSENFLPALTLTPSKISRLEGSLAHKAIELGLTSQMSELERFSQTYLRGIGISEALVINLMVKRVIELLMRFERHPLAEKIRNAKERKHELRYTTSEQGQARNGIIDLLILLDDRWTILDFKTDYITTADELEAQVKKHRPQLQRYADVLRMAMRIDPIMMICFLDDRGEISIQVI